MLTAFASFLRTRSGSILEEWGEALSGEIDQQSVEYLREQVKSTLETAAEIFERGRSDSFLAEELQISEEFLRESPPSLTIEDCSRAVCTFFDVLESAAHKEFEISKEEQDWIFATSVITCLIFKYICAGVLSSYFSQQRLLKEKKVQFEDVLSRLTEVRERDQRRLAFDLHDGPAQALSSALLQVDMLEDQVTSEESRAELKELRALLASSLGEIRTLTRQLHPRALEVEGLVSKVRDYVEEFGDRTNISVNLKVSGEERELTPSAQIAIFRIVQEALFNVQKHADASRVDIDLCLGKKEIECSITDNGEGFSVEEVLETSPMMKRFGLLGMRERVELLMGDFSIVSKPRKGTKIKFKVPIWRPKMREGPRHQRGR